MRGGKNNYKRTLVHFMSFTNGVVYTMADEFTIEQLSTLTPTQVERWLKFKAYGSVEPEEGALPTMCRSSSLMYWKKALSSFVTNRLMKWNAIAHVGTPTMSTEVNDLIKKVKKAEVRKQGKASQARRSLRPEEYVRMLTILREKPDMLRRYCIPALTIFQYNMIGRIDDCCQFLMENLTANPENDFTLRAKLNWSKNVSEE